MFSFYGSKRRLAKYYPAPECDVIIEPFCGSAAYSLYGDNWEREVHLYDVDPRIVSVWEWLISATRQDILNLPMFGAGVCIDQFQTLSQPEKWFLGYMISASTRNPKKTATVKTNWKESSQKKIADMVSNVDHWDVECCDFREIPNRFGTWFVDPPYKKEGKWYDHKLKPEEYVELRSHVEAWSGQVIVCESVEADWLEFKPLVENKGQSNNLKIEGLWQK